jgi:hypothetical protein
VSTSRANSVQILLAVGHREKEREMTEYARELAKSFRAVGAIENADVLDRLATALAGYRANNTPEAITADPVTHFLAYRRAVGGPEFGIPDHGEELAEALVEYVMEHKQTFRDPDAPLARKPQ